jgi:hypothetical protein
MARGPMAWYELHPTVWYYSVVYGK